MADENVIEALRHVYREQEKQTEHLAAIRSAVGIVAFVLVIGFALAVAGFIISLTA